MNKKQKEVELAKLRDEKKVLAALKKQYEEAAKEVMAKIHIHDNKIDIMLSEWDEIDEERRSILQAQIYQKKFQQQLKAQIDETVKKLNAGQYGSIEEYLKDSYTTAAVGNAYDLHGQGVPLVIPIDKKAMLKSVELDPKLSNKLYGSYMDEMKDNIRAEVSRGIATADSYDHIARNISNRTNQSFNKTMRIVRTEGHRIQIEAAYEQQQKAKKAGADIVKQWDSTLDGRTRPSHRKLDGQIRELDEPFEVNGHKAMHPAGFGRPEEDINCRCALLQRAKWALDDEELETLKDRAAYYELDKTKNFEDFQKKYLKAAEEAKTMPTGFVPAKTIEEAKHYANDKLGLFRADYDKMPLDFANMINKEVTMVYDTFGNLNAKGRLEAIIIWPKKVSWYAAYSSNSKLVGLKNVTSKGVLKKWAKDAAEQYATGFWSSNNAEHVIRHELGHAVQHMILDNNPAKLNRIQLLHKRLMRELDIDSWSANKTDPDKLKRAGKHISYYALSNENELVAESVAEYMSGNPRPVAKKIIEILTSDNMDFDLDEIMKEIL